MTAKLREPDPCPFCGVLIAGLSPGVWQHPNTRNGCVLSLFQFRDRQIAVWNIRAPAPSPWQDIATCPNLTASHPPVDLWSAQGFRMCSCQIDVVEYRAVNDPRPDRYGWTDSEGHGSIEDYGPFTHWMPLPEPPK